MKNTLALAIALTLAAGAPATAASLQFTAKPTQLVYVAQPVIIVTTLKNTTTAPLYLSASWNGTIQIVSVARNGRTVAPQRLRVERELNFASALVDSLRLVKPGGTISSGSGSDAGSLRAMAYDTPFTQSVTLFSIATPGVYDVVLRYQFPRIATPANHAYTAATAVSHLRFTVK